MFVLLFFTIFCTAFLAVYLTKKAEFNSRYDSGYDDGKDDGDGGWPEDRYDGPKIDLPPGVYLESEYEKQKQKDEVLI